MSRSGGGYRRKRWVSETYGQRTGQIPSVARKIEVWCEARSHEPVYLGVLTSRQGVALQEVWVPEGPHLTTEALILARHEHADPDVLGALGMIAERHRFLCPKCGLDVLAGDRLAGTSGRPGFRSVWERSGDRDVRAVAVKTDALLSQTADAGVSRLPLSALGRMLSL